MSALRTRGAANNQINFAVAARSTEKLPSLSGCVLMFLVFALGRPPEILERDARAAKTFAFGKLFTRGGLHEADRR
jgi:hypothetical protein